MEHPPYLDYKEMRYMVAEKLEQLSLISKGNTSDWLAKQKSFLLAAWHQYRDAYNEQEEAKKHVKKLAQKIAKRPHVIRLEIYDKLVSGVPEEPKALADLVNEKERFARMVQPLLWMDYTPPGDRSKIQVTGDTVDVMRDFLVSLGEKGARLKSLCVTVSVPEDYTRLRCDPGHVVHLESLVKGLKHFSFWGGRNGRRGKNRPEGELESLKSLLDPLMSSNDLRQVGFRLDCVEAMDKTQTWHFNTLLDPRPWDHLRKLAISNAPISVPEFVGFLDGKSLSLGLIYSWVVAGTWRVLLDAMRDMTDVRRPAASRLTLETFHHCTGAEIINMDYGRWVEVFETQAGRYVPGLGRRVSLAHAYVAHCPGVDQNPLAPFALRFLHL